MVETGNGGGPLRRRVIALEERMHLEAGLRAAQGAELTALGVVQRGLLGTVQALRETQLEHGVELADHTRRLETLQTRLERVDERLETLDAKVDNVDLHVEELDLKVERILEILEPADG
ncbi:MAG TPA: hypothetical protein VEV65_06330 [Kineosporiaceae bacterium]|nr:hypothetical protein [Kineosporiaceae bacterium]